jgi:archaellum component FlaC
LTLINNNFRKTKAEREGKEKEIEMKDEEISHLDKETRNLKQ